MICKSLYQDMDPLPAESQAWAEFDLVLQNIIYCMLWQGINKDYKLV